MKNINIGIKIAGMVGSLLILMIAASGYGIIKLNHIGGEMREIAEENIPLADLVTEASIRQLEQAVWFERGLGLFYSGADKKKVMDARVAFTKYAKLFDDNFKKALQLAELATSRADTVELEKEFQTIREQLGRIGTEHGEYEKHVGHVLMLLAKGDTRNTGPHIEKLKAEEMKLIDKTGQLLKRIVKLSKEAANEAKESGVEARKNMLIITLISIILGVTLALVFTRQITGPLRRVVSSLKDIAQGEGDLTRHIRTRSGDEVGELARWFNLFLDRLHSMIKETVDNTEILNTYSANLLILSDKMTLGAEETLSSSENVGVAVVETSTNMELVSTAVLHTSENIGVVATAAEQLTVTIGEITRSTEKAKSVSDKAVIRVQNASTKVGELGTAATDINKVTETITEISEQTNLLALNATIEAARGGEAGKGFAVVANEIKELARQTAEATLEIKEKINGIQESTDKTVIEIEQVTQVMGEINSIVANIAYALDEQSSATRRIADNAVQASQGIEEVKEHVNHTTSTTQDIANAIANVKDSSGETARGSFEVNNSASELKKMSEILIRMVEQFKV